MVIVVDVICDFEWLIGGDLIDIVWCLNVYVLIGDLV